MRGQVQNGAEVAPTREQQHKMMIVDLAHQLLQEAAGRALTDPSVSLNSVVERAFQLAHHFDDHTQAYMKAPTLHKAPAGLKL